MDTQQRIDEMVKTNKVFLFMKGTPDFPQCGFSMRAVSILKALDVLLVEIGRGDGRKRS